MLKEPVLRCGCERCLLVLGHCLLELLNDLLNLHVLKLWQGAVMFEAVQQQGLLISLPLP